MLTFLLCAFFASAVVVRKQDDPHFAGDEVEDPHFAGDEAYQSDEKEGSLSELAVEESVANAGIFSCVDMCVQCRNGKKIWIERRAGLGERFRQETGESAGDSFQRKKVTTVKAMPFGAFVGAGVGVLAGVPAAVAGASPLLVLTTMGIGAGIGVAAPPIMLATVGAVVAGQLAVDLQKKGCMSATFKTRGANDETSRYDEAPTQELYSVAMVNMTQKDIKAFVRGDATQEGTKAVASEGDINPCSTFLVSTTFNAPPSGITKVLWDELRQKCLMRENMCGDKDGADKDFDSRIKKIRHYIYGGAKGERCIYE